MTLTVVGIEKVGQCAKVSLTGKVDPSCISTQLFLYIPWDNREAYQLDEQYKMAALELEATHV